MKSKTYQLDYDQIAHRYSQMLNRRMLLVGGEKGFRMKLFKHVKNYINGEILELCCGPGSFTKYLVQQSPKSYIKAIDLCSSFIQIAKQDCDNPLVQFEVGDATCLNENDNSFDTVFLSMALHEMDERAITQSLQEVRRVLRKDGKAIFIEHHLPKNILVRLYYNLVVVDKHEKEEVENFHAFGLKHYMKEAGFHIVETKVLMSGCIQTMVVTPRK